MNRYFYSFMAALTVISCDVNRIPEPAPEELVDIEIVASTEEPQSKVAFSEEGSNIKMRWEENDRLNIYIKKANGTFERALVDGNPSYMDGSERNADGTVMTFTGKSRPLADGESYVFTYPPITDEWDGNVVSQDLSGINTLADLKKYTQLQFTPANEGLELQKNSCIVKFSVSDYASENNRLPASAKVKSLTINTVNDASVFTISSSLVRDSKLRRVSNSVTYVFSDLETNSEGKLPSTLYLAMPIVSKDYAAGYELHLVIEKDGVISDYKSTNGINAGVAFTEAQKYALARNSFETAINPGASVGGGSNVQEPGKTVASVIGPWDEYGNPTDDIFGVLANGKAFMDTHQEARQVATAAANLYSGTVSGREGDDFRSYFWTLCGDNGEGNRGPQYVYNNQTAAGSDLNFNNIRIVKPTKVYLTFVGTRAWNKNSLGYYVYPTADEASYSAVPSTFPQQLVQEQLLFPSLSQPRNANNAADKNYAVIDPGTTVQMLYPVKDANGNITGYKEEFPAGTTIGFVVRVCSWNDTILPSALNLQSRALYTNVAWNSNNTKVTGSLSGWPLTYREGNSDRSITNAIAARRLFTGTRGADPRTLVYGAFDMAPTSDANYNARFCNPVYMVYTEQDNAIDWTGEGQTYKTGNDYWMTGYDRDFYTISSLNDPNSPVFVDASGDTGWTRRESNFLSAMHDKHKWIISSTVPVFDNKKLVSEPVQADVASELILNGDGRDYYLYNVGTKHWLAGQSGQNPEQIITANYQAVKVTIWKIQELQIPNTDKKGFVYKIQYHYNSNNTYMSDTGNGKAVFGQSASFDEKTCSWLLTRHLN